MTVTTLARQTTKVFTFGAGQPYAGYYVVISSTENNHLDLMMEVHGRKWAFEYSLEDFLALEQANHMKCLLWLSYNHASITSRVFPSTFERSAV